MGEEYKVFRVTTIDDLAAHYDQYAKAYNKLIAGLESEGEVSNVIIDLIQDLITTSKELGLVQTLRNV